MNKNGGASDEHVCLAGYNSKLLSEIERQMRCYFEEALTYSIWDFNINKNLSINGTIIVFF